MCLLRHSRVRAFFYNFHCILPLSNFLFIYELNKGLRNKYSTEELSLSVFIVAMKRLVLSCDEFLLQILNFTLLEIGYKIKKFTILFAYLFKSNYYKIQLVL